MRIVFFLSPDLCDFEVCNLQISSKTINFGNRSSLPPLVRSCSCHVLLVSCLDVLLGWHVVPQFLELPRRVLGQRTQLSSNQGFDVLVILSSFTLCRWRILPRLRR